jgi:D-aminoacyl-tRNA deacylase
MQHSFLMRAVLQRVRRARVDVDGHVSGAIERGILVLLGVSKQDTEADADYLADKIVNLRIFEDAGGKMNLSVLDQGGSLLVVSQFTLYADCSRGRRPSFDEAAPAEAARRLYEYFVGRVRSLGVAAATGVFQARMLVSLENEGPVTMTCESPKKF